MDFYKTGIADLDNLLHGGRGFRAGRGYVISGPTQSGKTILSIHIMISVIQQGGVFTYVTIGRPVIDLVELFIEFNIDVNGLLEKLQVTFLDFFTKRNQGEAGETKRHLSKYLSNKALANIIFGEDPCDPDEFLRISTRIHEHREKITGKPGFGIIDAVSDQVVIAYKRGISGQTISDLHFRARQRFAKQKHGLGFHLFTPVGEIIKTEYWNVLEDLHLNEDGIIHLDVVRDEVGVICDRIMSVKSVFGAADSKTRLHFEINSKEGIITKKARPAAQPASLAEIKKCLYDFSEYVSSEGRMAFWDREKGTRKHRWKKRPENEAKGKLETFLRAKFGDRVYILEEIKSGAGKIDLFLIVPGGSNVIIELKMCGRGYSLRYSSGGLTQLKHYMANRRVGDGFLVIFDARKRDYSKGFQKNLAVAGLNIETIVVDVRPRVE